MVRMEIYIREGYLMNKVACEDHFSFENYIRMPIAATFWMLEKIRPAIESYPCKRPISHCEFTCPL